MKILICDDSIDGIFTAVYHAWSLRCNHNDIKIQINDTHNLELFSEYITVASDLSKSMKVTRTIVQRFGEDTYLSVCRAALSDGADKADVIYRLLIFGFGLYERTHKNTSVSAKNTINIMDYLSNPFVCTVFTLSRQTSNEAHHYLGFIRFRELDNGILLSEISPKNNILTIISAHFTDRLPNENWIIYDDIRAAALVHEQSKEPILVSGEHLDPERISRHSENESEFQKLWKTFFESIAVRERISPNLQRQNLPKRFRDHLSEFN